MKRQLMRLLASGLIVHAAMPASAPAQPAPGAVPPPPSAQPATTEPTSAQPYSNEQLDALLAPIALYPDPLLTQVLMASTYPLQVVEASRWLEDPAHKSLTGDELTRALNPQPWDASVKSLVPFPVVLATLNNNLDWMQQLGYAFATQQADVFDAIQRLRVQAQANGSLQSSQHQVVRAEFAGGRRSAGDRHRTGTAGRGLCSDLLISELVWFVPEARKIHCVQRLDREPSWVAIGLWPESTGFWQSASGGKDWRVGSLAAGDRLCRNFTCRCSPVA